MSKVNSKCSFTVMGSGPFPMDMLRYDECHPIFPGDAANIEYTIRGVTPPEPIRLNSNKVHPTEARWESFGWSVADVEYHD